MKRAKINNYGLKIAKPGYDVETATEDQLLFSPSTPIQRVSESGIVASGPYVQAYGTWSFFSSSAYYTTNITFSKTYSKIPQVLVNAVYMVNGVACAIRPISVRYNAFSRLGSFYSYLLPVMYILVSKTGLIVYTLYDNSFVPYINYQVMETDIE